MLTCKSLLSQQWGSSHIPTAVIITGPVSIRVGSGVERWVRCAWSNDALCQLVGGTKPNLEDQSLLLRLLSSSSNLQAAVLDQLEHLAGAAGQPVCPVPQVVGPLDSNSSASPGPLFLSVLPCFLTEANAKGQSSSKVHISKGGRRERIRFGWFSACLGISSSTHPSDIRASGVSPAYDASPALLIQWHIGGPPLLPSSRFDSQPRLDSYAQPSQFNRSCSLQQHSSRGYHDPRCPYPSKLSDPSENGRVCAPTGDGSATATITATSDTCASPCHPLSSLNTPNFSSVEQPQSPASTHYHSLSRAAKQQLVSPSIALPTLRPVDAPSRPDADQRCAAGQRPGSSKCDALAAGSHNGGKSSAAGGDVGGEVRPDSEEGCADIPRSLRAQRNSLVLTVVPLAVTIFSLPGGAVLHQNAASIEYYGERTAATAADAQDEGLKPISYHELLGSLASRGSARLSARQRRRQPKARAGPSESARDGWDSACTRGEGKEVTGASACDGDDGAEAQEEDVLQQLFEFEATKLEQMLAMVLQNEGGIWQGIVRVPATLQAQKFDADSDDSSSNHDEGSYEDMYTYISSNVNAPDKCHPGYRNDDDEEGADVPGMIQEAGSSSKRPPPHPQAPVASGVPHTPTTAAIAEAGGADDMNEQGLRDGLPAHHDQHLQGSMAEVTTGLKQRIHNDKRATSATVNPTADSAATSGEVDGSSSCTTAAAGVESTAPSTSAVTFSFQKSAFERTNTAQPIPVPSGSDSMDLPGQQVLSSVSAAPGALGQLDQDRESPFTLRLSRLLVRKDTSAAAAAPGISCRSSSFVIESMTSPDREKLGGPPDGLVKSNSLTARAMRRTFSRLEHQQSVDVAIDAVHSREGVISGEGGTSGGGDRQRGLNAAGSGAGGRMESTELTNTGRISLSKVMVGWTRSLTTNTTAAAGPPSPAPAKTPSPLASVTDGSGTVSGLMSGDSAHDPTLLTMAATTGAVAAAATGGGMMNLGSLSSNPSHGEMSRNGSGMCENLGHASNAEPRLPSLPNAHSLPAMQRLPVSRGGAVQCPGNKVGNSAATSSAGSQMPRWLLPLPTTEDIDGMAPGITASASASNNAGSVNNGPAGGPWQRSSTSRVSPDGPPNSGTPASFCPAVPEESGSLSEVQLSRKPTMASSNPPSGSAGGPSSALVSKALLASMSAACKPLTHGLLGRFLSYASERRFLPHRNDSYSAERRHEGRSEFQHAVMSAMAVSAPRSRRNLRSMFGVAPPAVAKVSLGDETTSRQASEDANTVAYGELHVQLSTQSCLVSSCVGMSHPPPFGDGSTGTSLQDSANPGMSNNAATQPWRASSARRAAQAVSGRPSFHVSSGTSLMQPMSAKPRCAVSRRSSFSAARRSLHLSQGPLATSTWQMLMSASNDNEATQALPTAPFFPASTSPGNISSYGGSIGTTHLAAVSHALTVPAPTVPSAAQCAATRAAVSIMPTTLDMFGSSDPPAAHGSTGVAAVNSLFSSMQGVHSSHIDTAASMPSMLLVTAMASNNLDHTQLDMHAQFRSGGGAGRGTGIRVAPNVRKGYDGGGSTNAFDITPAVAAAETTPSLLLAPASPFKCPNAQTIISMPSAGRSSKQPPSIVISQAQPRQNLERLRQSMEQSRESMERPRKSLEKPRKSMERSRKSIEHPSRSLERASMDHGYQVANITVAPATAGGTLGIPGVESEGDLVLLKILASDEEGAVALAAAGVACGGGGGGTSGCTLPTSNPQSKPWSSVLSSFRFGGSDHTASILSPSAVSTALFSSTLPTSSATGRSTATAGTGFAAPGTRAGPCAVTTGATVTAAPTQQQQPSSSASPRTRPPSRVLAFAARLRTAPQPLAAAPVSASYLTNPSFSGMNSFTTGNIMASTGGVGASSLMNDGGSHGESYTGLEPALNRPRTHVGVQQQYGRGSTQTDNGRFGCRKSMSSAALGDMVRRAAAVEAAAAASSSTSAAFPPRNEGVFSYSNMVAVAAAAMVTADSSISHDGSTRHQQLLSPVSNHDGGANQAGVAAGSSVARTREYGDGTNMGNHSADVRDGRPCSSGAPKQQHQRRSRCSPRRSHPSHHHQQTSPQLQQQQTEQSECWHEVCATAIRDPGSGSVALVVVQQDVSDKVVAERHLQQVAEVEHRLLEQIFPRHVLQYITEESVVPSHCSIAANTQLPVGPDGATISGPSSAGVPASSPLLNHGSTSSLTSAPTAAYNIVSWRPQIRDCNRLATWHPKVTVLFADIQGFTPMCKVLPARVVMAFLNDLFTRFDAMLDTYRVYKVETIGDCYMVAGGLIMEDEDGMAAVRGGGAVDPTQADDVFGFAQAMLRAASAVHMPTTGGPVSVRVGIHSGPVVSGVVGTRMPRFCLFGDTVNTASRMESTGIPGSIHVSQDTYDMLSGQPGWQPTGGIEVKGKGIMATYVWSPLNTPTPAPTAVSTSVVLASSSFANTPAASSPPPKMPPMASPAPSLAPGLALRSIASAPASAPCNGPHGSRGGGVGGAGGVGGDTRSMNGGFRSGSLTTTFSFPASCRTGGGGRQDAVKSGSLHHRPPVAMASAGKLLAQMEALARSITGNLEEEEAEEKEVGDRDDRAGR